MKTIKNRITQRSIARSAKIGPDFFNHILQGRKQCPRRVALRLEATTGINRDIWVWGTSKQMKTALREHISGGDPGYGY